MKTITSIAGALVSTLLFGNLVFAHGSINQRERRHQRRIADGVRDGELTRNEAGKLEKQQARIHSAEARAKADGEFTANERAKIQQKQNKASRQIYNEKHEKQVW